MALHDPEPVQRKPASPHSGAVFSALIVPPGGEPGEPDIRIAGITIALRQRRQLLRLGARKVDEAASNQSAMHGPLLLIEAGLVADERLISAILAVARQRGSGQRPLLSGGPADEAGGLAWLPAGSKVLSWEELRDGRADRLDLSAVDCYSPDRRRQVPLIWERPANKAAARQVGTQLLAAAQKGCLDWPARFIHPPIENAIVRLLWPSPVSPNMVSVLAFVLGLYAAWCFATGAQWTGLLIALAVGPIDGIDGKLARTRIEFSRWGDLEHVGDKVVEYAWFACLAAGLGTAWAWALAVLIVCMALAEALLGEFYRRMTGTQLDDAGPFEQAYRLVSGRRNTFFWSLLPFAWFGAWGAGLIMIAAYATANLFVMLNRFFIRLASYGRVHSAAIAANLDATAYGLLHSAVDEPDTSVTDKRVIKGPDPAGMTS